MAARQKARHAKSRLLNVSWELNMTPTLEECKMYTEVFRSMKLEILVSMIVGIVIGALAAYNRRGR
jgi:hypothetical protein